ncbi:energy-coupling factor transporter transmembrane component T family protein [Brevibacillus sp. B_LB10_24]|uniref:energy-coupling factor transporter transmembrane component T family protein n=1 Tax=Brevibacillus sp. B_LB10_24 TaxID=3380645 RepID=UPI0038BA2488
MKSMSLYVNRHSPVHSVDPITKLYYIGAAIVVPFIAPSFHAAWVWLLLSVCLLLIAKVFRRALPILGFVAFVLATVIVIQSLFHPGNATAWFYIGSIGVYQEGFWYALGICFRALNIVCAFSILVLTTKPSDLVEALVRKGLSPRIGYVLSSVFQIIPQMVATMGTITDAQRSRGMETDGSLLVRIRAFFPLLGPVVLSSLLNTKERALALQVRGFNATGEKTFLHEQQTYPYSAVLQWGLIGVVMIVIIWRILS